MLSTNILLLPQRASLKRASKAVNLINVVGLFPNISLERCIVVGDLSIPKMQCAEQDKDKYNALTRSGTRLTNALSIACLFILEFVMRIGT